MDVLVATQRAGSQAPIDRPLPPVAGRDESFFGDILMQTVKKIGFSLLAVTLAGLPGVSQTPPGAPHARSATTRVILRRGYLGVGVVDIAPDRVKALNLKDDSGVEVKRVDENKR